jgi:Zn-dependent M28 family amino/carboxypeptidase
VHVVLFASEEFGGHSGRDFLEAHRDELDRYVAALESDSGSFAPAGFSARTTPEILDRLRVLAAPLDTLGASAVKEGWSGVDIGPIVEQGVPGIAHRTHNEPYFDYHHSPADTLDKVDPEILAQNVAVVAGLAWAIAEDPRSLRQ